MHGDLVFEYFGKNLATVHELTSVPISSIIKCVCVCVCVCVERMSMKVVHHVTLMTKCYVQG
jgi:hypothetical protein